jgi:nucleotide-binding universal stress UspA family protein
MSSILVGVDASDRSLDAIAFAREVAVASGAAVVIANVFPYDDRPSRMANLGFRHVLEDDAEKVVARMRDALGDLGPDRVRTAVAARTSAAHGLQELAEAERAALLIVGSSHVGAVGRVMPGSTAERLLHGAPCPVAVVPRGHRERGAGLHRIAVAYDGSPESEAALHAAAILGRATGGRLSVVHVLNELDFTTPAMMGGGPGIAQIREDAETARRAELDEVVAQLPSAEAVFALGEAAPTLLAQTARADVLVTGSRGYGPLRAVLTGGVTGRVLRDAECPVLIVPRGVETPLDDLLAAEVTT